jgi:hypothetical protein
MDESKILDEKLELVQFYQVEVELPSNFAREQDKIYLNNLFQTGSMTQGGPIKNLTYWPHRSLAYIQFKNRETSKRVLEQKVIECGKYRFVVRPKLMEREDGLYTEKNGTASAGPKLPEQSHPVSTTTVATTTTTTKNKFFMTFAECKSNEVERVKRIGAILAKTKPDAVYLVDEQAGKWLLEFGIEKNLGKIFKKCYHRRC